MKVLIITQKVDKTDPVLGFFHKWVDKLSEKFDRVSMICLGKGVVDLPQNVDLFSLGKEKNVPSKNNLLARFKYAFNFYKYLWKLKGEYDVVFVHMNQEYVLLGGLFWRLFGKKIFLWRNHPQGGLFTRVAVMLSEKVFCTSAQSFTAKFKKTKIMPVGIDTELFYIDKSVSVLSNSILSLGRISPIKNIDKMIDFAIDLEKSGINFVLDIVGDPANSADYKYLDALVQKSEKLIEKGMVNFIPAVSQEGAALMFKSHNIFINLTPSGSMDKTILEAAVCGCIPVVNNQFFVDIFEKNMITSGEVVDISEKIKFWLNSKETEREKISEKLRKYVLENHSLNALINDLVKEIY